ncbi:Putative Zinc finger, RING-type [Septoria linicola]|uniref:Anaphase-promoting complex subunit 11 n=1 Tax=Septoria linicola TaxID=215465 RepID=A0A9Q9EGC4_9PEZI|nr:putative Zinc finger, RING-type [Septoria linicola]USW48779.1 Putative Zinc finger, RING-type [Septoria linicola]
MKVKINSYKAVAAWKWDLPEGSDRTCGICRVDFEGTCSKCKYPGDDCPIMIGECKHCFHMHCVTDWLQAESSQGRCPMCRQPFREKVAEVKEGTPRTPAPREQPRNNSTSTAGSSSSGGSG